MQSADITPACEPCALKAEKIGYRDLMLETCGKSAAP
jgi:hypothetical protein